MTPGTGEGREVKTLAQAINEAIEQMRAAGGVLDAPTGARSAVGMLQPEQLRVIALQRVAGIIQRRLDKMLDQTDDRQGWLVGVPRFIKVAEGVMEKDQATLPQYRDAKAELEARIKSYKYPRRSPVKLKRDKRKLAAMGKEDRRVAPLMAGTPEMKMGQAIELCRENLGRQQRERAIRRRWERHKART